MSQDHQLINQNDKRRLQKKLVKACERLSIEKKKSNNMVVKNTKLSQKMRNKR